LRGAKIFHGASPTFEERLKQAGNFQQQTFRLLGVSANQLTLHVAVESRQRSAIFRLHVVAQSDAKFRQDFDSLGHLPAALEDVTGLQRPDGFAHGLHGRLIQNPDQFHGGRRLHSLSHVLLVVVRERHLDSYRCFWPAVETILLPAFEGKPAAQKTSEWSSSLLSSQTIFESKVAESYSQICR
jgi:hypothetical protein